MERKSTQSREYSARNRRRLLRYAKRTPVTPTLAPSTLSEESRHIWMLFVAPSPTGPLLPPSVRGPTLVDRSLPSVSGDVVVPVSERRTNSRVYVVEITTDTRRTPGIPSVGTSVHTRTVWSPVSRTRHVKCRTRSGSDEDPLTFLSPRRDSFPPTPVSRKVQRGVTSGLRYQHLLSG